jgi:hypothetical protein
MGGQGVARYSSIFVSAHNRHDAPRGTWVGWIRGPAFHRAVVIIDLEKICLVREFDRTEVMLAIRIIFGQEGIEIANLREQRRALHEGERFDAGRDYDCTA